MEVILTQDVDKVGKAGSVVKVKDGFARNFLIPNRLAVPLTAANQKKLETEKQQKNDKLQKLKGAAENLADKLSGLSLTLPVLIQEENQDKLYGSITSVDIAAALKNEGLEIDENSIMLDEHIKSLGIYQVPIRLHPEVTAKLKVWVVKK